MVTTANPEDFATYIVEEVEVPWEQIKKTARETLENRALFVRHISHLLSRHKFLSDFCRKSDRSVPKERRWHLARKVANVILATK